MSNDPQKNDKPKHVFEIHIMARSWREWLIWASWLFSVIIFLQGMLASYKEYETRPAAIFGSLFFLFLFGGIVSWLVKRNQLL